MNGKEFKIDLKTEYTKEDDEAWGKFVFQLFYSIGCRPKYSEDENRKIVLDYLKKNCEGK